MEFNFFVSDGNSIFLSVGSITKVTFSTGSVSPNGSSVNSNAGCFVNVVKFRKTIL